MGLDGRCSPHSQVWRGVDMLVKKKYMLASLWKKNNYKKRWNRCLTTTAYTLRRFRGPSSYCSASENAGSIWQVTGVTAVLQNRAHREQAPVRVCEVYPAVLDHVWPHTSWEKRPGEVGN